MPVNKKTQKNQHQVLDFPELFEQTKANIWQNVIDQAFTFSQATNSEIQNQDQDLFLFELAARQVLIKYQIESSESLIQVCHSIARKARWQINEIQRTIHQNQIGVSQERRKAATPDFPSPKVDHQQRQSFQNSNNEQSHLPSFVNLISSNGNEQTEIDADPMNESLIKVKTNQNLNDFAESNQYDHRNPLLKYSEPKSYFQPELSYQNSEICTMTQNIANPNNQTFFDQGVFSQNQQSVQSCPLAQQIKQKQTANKWSDKELQIMLKTIQMCDYYNYEQIQLDLNKTRTVQAIKRKIDLIMQQGLENKLKNLSLKKIFKEIESQEKRQYNQQDEQDMSQIKKQDKKQAKKSVPKSKKSKKITKLK